MSNDPLHLSLGGFQLTIVMSRHSIGNPILHWYKIQEMIADSETDILLLLDCCYAAQAARGRGPSQGKFEVLAAAAMGMMTLKAGDMSFTHALLQEMKTAVGRDGFVRIGDLHARLCQRESKLFATPVHISIRPNRQPLVLEPATRARPRDPTVGGATSLLHVLVQIKQDLSSDTLVQVSEWLRSDVPYIISGLQVVERTEHIQHAVQDIQEGKKAFVKQLQTATKDDITEAWAKVVSLVSTYSHSNELSGNAADEAQKTNNAKDFLRHLDAENKLVMDALERCILTAPELEDSNMLEQAADDDVLKQLGIDRQLQMRRIVLSSNPLVAGQHERANKSAADESSVIQEVKKYGPYIDPAEMPALTSRVDLLAKLLAVPKTHEFRSLRCLGWSHQDLVNTYTLDFEVPSMYTGRQYTTLYTIIKESTGRARPNMNERVWISYTLARAINKWHIAGWVHQSISSHNVLFFFEKDTHRVDYSQPFLHGFEFARPDSDPSIGRAADDLEFNVYRHPERQGNLRKGHRKKHDIYSLGVVLLEIGLWQLGTKLISDSRQQQPSARDRQAKLLRHCSERLPHFSGISFEAAVYACLSSNGESEWEDKDGCEFARLFQQKVVDELAKGVRIFS